MYDLIKFICLVRLGLKNERLLSAKYGIKIYIKVLHWTPNSTLHRKSSFEGNWQNWLWLRKFLRKVLLFSLDTGTNPAKWWQKFQYKPWLHLFALNQGFHDKLATSIYVQGRTWTSDRVVDCKLFIKKRSFY